MFQYQYKKGNTECYVGLPLEITFNYEFQDEISQLIQKSLVENTVKVLYVACLENSKYDKLSMAYLYNVLIYISKRITVKWNNVLRSIIAPKVSFVDGKNFMPIDIIGTLKDSNMQYFIFSGEKDVDKPVDEMTNILVEKNVTIGQSDVKEFLSTTIGEIFSNCINHSEEENIFLAYDINCENDSRFYLCVNVIDYGKTIVDNVKAYLAVEKRQGKDVYDDSSKCMEWAIQSGNTTRKGSGGYGLPTLISYIKSAGGELYILSEKANYVLIKGKQEIKESKGIFIGTSITFKVKLFDTQHAYAVDRKNKEIVSISLDEL